jgi:hypothetical protein
MHIMDKEMEPSLQQMMAHLLAEIQAPRRNKACQDKADAKERPVMIT